MNEDIFTTHIDYAHTLIEPLVSFSHLAAIHRRTDELISNPSTRRRTLKFFAALARTITLSLDEQDPHRSPRLADGSDPSSDVLTATGQLYGSADAVSDVLSFGEDPAEALEVMALEDLDDGFAHFTMHSLNSLDDAVEWLIDVIDVEPEGIEAAHSAIRFALHRRRSFEGHFDPGLLVLIYHIAQAINYGDGSEEEVDAVTGDVAVVPGAYAAASR